MCNVILAFKSIFFGAAQANVKFPGVASRHDFFGALMLGSAAAARISATPIDVFNVSFAGSLYLKREGVHVGKVQGFGV